MGKDINIQKERKQQNTKRKISMGLNGNLGILELEGDLIEFERDVNQTMIDVLGAVLLTFSLIGVLFSLNLCRFGRVGFLPIVGFCANCFYFTNASLALFANGINWVDGLLSTIIMAILSIIICFFVIMFCRDMLVNDDEEKDELRAPRRKWTTILICLYVAIAVTFAVISTFCYFRKTSIRAENPAYIYQPNKSAH